MSDYRTQQGIINTIDTLCGQYREGAKRIPGCANLVDACEAPEIKDLAGKIRERDQVIAAYENYHGKLPDHILRMDSFGMYIVTFRPKVEMDVAKKESHLQVLKERLRSRVAIKALHRRYLSAAIVLICTMAMATSGLVSRNGNFGKATKSIDGVLIFEDGITGDRVAAGSKEGAHGILMANEAADQRLVSVERWSLNGDFNIVCEYESIADSLHVFKSPEKTETRLTQELLNMLELRLDKLSLLFKKDALPPYGIEILPIDGIDVEFKKWEARTPEGVVEYWSGKPIRHRD